MEKPSLVVWIQSIAVFDWVGIGIVLLFVILGLFRGARWQFRRFFGVLAAIVIARICSQFAAPVFSKLIDPAQPKLGLGVSFILLFLFSLTFLALLAHFLKASPEKQQRDKESGRNVPEPSKHRMIGACFGALTGIELILVVMACVLLFNRDDKNRELISRSTTAAASSRVLVFLGSTLPLEVNLAARAATTPAPK